MTRRQLEQLRRPSEPCPNHPIRERREAVTRVGARRYCDACAAFLTGKTNDRRGMVGYALIGALAVDVVRCLLVLEARATKVAS